MDATDTATPSVRTPDPSPVGVALEALATLARVHDRIDLAEAATGAVARLRSPQLRIVVLGEFKKGKSSLVNALVDAPVSAVDDDIATAARLEVVHAERPVAHWWRTEDRDEGPTIVDGPIPIDEVRRVCTDPTTRLVRAGLPRRLLRSGVVLVDTPGVGGMTSAAALATASALRDAHVALFVTDCSQELTAPELAALRDAAERGPHLVVVETKIDVSPYWRTIVEADCEHLRLAGIDARVVPLSNELRHRALRADDRGLNQESGFGELVRLVVEEFVPDARALAERAALRTARRVYRLLHEPLAVELTALDQATHDPEEHDPVAEAKQAVEEFKARAGRWQQVLSDGMADLVGAVDHDLKQRMRELAQGCEQELDEVDPDDVWDEFEPALYRRTAEALDANLTLLREHADELASRLATQLDDALPGGADVLLGAVWDTGEADGEAATRKDGDATSAGAKAHQAFRAGYGGAMPIMAVGGMALGVLGLGTLVLPLAAVAGVVAGRKALTDEQDRQLNQRRQQARVAVKRYTDDVLLRAASERKSMQRRVQRTLRDHFTARVKELAGTHGAALRAVESAAAADLDARRSRTAAVQAELARIEQIGIDLERSMRTDAPRREGAES